MTSIEISQPHVFPAKTLQLQTKLQHYAELGLQGSVNTQLAYKSDIKQFKSWCSLHGYVYLPCESIVLCEYFTECIETNSMKWATLQRALNGIRKYHKLAGKAFPDDELLTAVLTGIKRDIGVRQKKAPAFNAEVFGEMLDKLDETDPIQLRDKCLLLICLMGAFRRSEVVAIDLEHLSETADGYEIIIPRSKTNQFGEDEKKALFPNINNPTRCPIKVLEKWVEMLNRTSRTGPLFISFRRGEKPGMVRYTQNRLSGKSVGLILKQYMGDEYSAHSLRASFITISKRNGADNSSIMRQTGHKSSKMIERYTRLDNIHEYNAASTLIL